MRIQHALFLVTAAACTNQVDHQIKLPPIHSGSGTLQVGAFGFQPGSFHVIGDTVPGNASFVAAPLTDMNGQPPPSYGTGDYNITLSSINYTGSTQSMALAFSDPMAGDYLVVGAYREYTDGSGVDTVDQVVVIVKQSDFAVGATVALDGNDRIALFGSGPATADQPTVTGAALTGSITFTAGSLTPGDTITASVSGDFGPVDWGNPQPGGGTITAGNYTLTVGASSQVYCDGSLAGHEADFAGITAASLSLGDGAVTVATPSTSQVTVDGAAIQAAFGTTPFALDDQGNSLFAGFTNDSGAGPDGTQLAGKYFVVDASSATTTQINGGAGAGYVTSDNSGSCTVAFDATLTQ
jgi:hypothetical protein